jgi:hypothetical protein
MRKLLCGIASLLLIICAANVHAQKTAIKFGDIKPEDFSTKFYPIDSSAQAVILSDVGSSKYEGNTQGNFNIVFKRHTRIRILNRNAFDVATLSIPIYASGTQEEKIESLEAVTYNIENGVVKETKLDKSSIFKDRINKNFTVRKFTMPDLKEGCIIEIKYSFISPYIRDLRGWQFQREYPVLHSEYKIAVPSYFEFVTFKQGYHPFAVEKGDVSSETYNIVVPGETASDRSESFSVRAAVALNHWVMENVPALKKENYTTTLDNYVSKIDFQLSRLRYPNSPVRNIMNGWPIVVEQLMKDPDFGEGLSKGNNWMDDDIKKITAGATTRFEKAQRIYAYVRDNFTCTNHSRKYLSAPLKKIFQNKSGTVADLNLLLTAMLKQQDFEANPVLLSTRDNGKAYEAYPIMDQLNYVITEVKIDDKAYLLDASYNKLGFGKLSGECYNGSGRLIAETPLLIDLSPDSLREEKLTSIFIVNDEKEGLLGSYTSTLGSNESYEVREKVGKVNEQDLFKEIKKGFGLDIELSNGHIDSLKNYEEPVAIKYDFKFRPEEDILYVNPVFSEAIKENPFKAAERFYPVEMPYAVNETVVLKMDIPKGYKVEEMPKSTRVKLNEDEGMFEYLVSNIGGVVQLRSSLRLNKATFLPEDYETLRNFYAYIVKKHSEQIVLKKIN